jgi:Domain of unknown function (DUF6484)
MNEERAPATPSEAEATDAEPLAIESESESESDGESLLDLVLAEHQARLPPTMPEPTRIDGIVIARLTAIDGSGALRITLPWSPEPTAARSMAAIVEADLGSEVAVLFESGDPKRPVVMGRMHVPTPATSAAAHEPPEAASPATEAAPTTDVEADGERVVFEAEKEIVLRCGKSSITLTRAGKILIRGAYVLTRSSGVNRIQGGSVQIN